MKCGGLIIDVTFGRLGSTVRSHAFELKIWFEGCASRLFCIEIRTFNRPRGSRFALSIIITNLDAKSMTRSPFELNFEFEGVCERTPGPQV
jgi:hypothetical protein